MAPEFDSEVRVVGSSGVVSFSFNGAPSRFVRSLAHAGYYRSFETPDHDMRFLIVANPAAGSGAAHELSRQAERILSQRGHQVTAVRTDNAAATAEAVSAQANQPETTIVGCGGDGTIHHIVQALMTSGGRARLGIIPCGPAAQRATRVPS